MNKTISINGVSYSKQHLHKMAEAGKRGAKAGELTRDLFIYYTQVYRPQNAIDKEFHMLTINQINTLKNSMGFAFYKIQRAKNKINSEITKALKIPQFVEYLSRILK